MTINAHFTTHSPWPAAKWRQQAIRFGRYLGLIPDEIPAMPPTRRQLLMAAQDRRRAEQRRAAELARSRH
ncbi:MAG TPA: hypothetical protein VGU03_01350 [Frateuria sp.]|uniref:hypothetical protein n=1 Tax=Frateuria sp. TaxID=2211372 RepID=UPI002DE25B1B|nr:hypothetical protein [Frateuria sp.]